MNYNTASTDVAITQFYQGPLRGKLFWISWKNSSCTIQMVIENGGNEADQLSQALWTFVTEAL